MNIVKTSLLSIFLLLPTISQASTSYDREGDENSVTYTVNAYNNGDYVSSYNKDLDTYSYTHKTKAWVIGPLQSDNLTNEEYCKSFYNYHQPTELDITNLKYLLDGGDVDAKRVAELLSFKNESGGSVTISSNYLFGGNGESFYVRTDKEDGVSKVEVSSVEVPAIYYSCAPN